MHTHSSRDHQALRHRPRWPCFRGATISEGRSITEEPLFWEITQTLDDKRDVDKLFLVLACLLHGFRDSLRSVEHLTNPAGPHQEGSAYRDSREWRGLS